MGKIIQYEHYGAVVSVDEDLRGKHREHCLCFRCEKMKPGQGLTHCPIASLLYAVCVALHLVTRVRECPVFIEGEPDLSKMEG